MRRLWRRPEEEGMGAQDRDLLPNPCELTARDPQIEAYLTRVCAQLRRTVPPARLQELRAEMAAHLEALVDAHVELGSDADSAVREALRHFGSARRVCRDWSRQRWRSAASAEIALAAGGFLYFTVVATGAGFLGPWSPAHWLGEALLPLSAGCYWGRHPSSGYRPLGAVAAAGLLASALLPLSPEYGSAPAMLLWAAVLRSLVWSMIACGAAGLTATIGVLRNRWRDRETA